MDSANLKPSMEGGLEKPTRHIIDWKNPDPVTSQAKMDEFKNKIGQNLLEDEKITPLI